MKAVYVYCLGAALVGLGGCTPTELSVEPQHPAKAAAGSQPPNRAAEVLSASYEPPVSTGSAKADPHAHHKHHHASEPAKQPPADNSAPAGEPAAPAGGAHEGHQHH